MCLCVCVCVCICVHTQHELIVYKREWARVARAKGEHQEAERRRREADQKLKEAQGRYAEEEKPVTWV